MLGDSRSASTQQPGHLGCTERDLTVIALVANFLDVEEADIGQGW
jgi:hypothetical protein